MTNPLVNNDERVIAIDQIAYGCTARGKLSLDRDRV